MSITEPDSHLNGIEYISPTNPERFLAFKRFYKNLTAEEKIALKALLDRDDEIEKLLQQRRLYLSRRKEKGNYRMSAEQKELATRTKARTVGEVLKSLGIRAYDSKAIIENLRIKIAQALEIQEPIEEKTKNPMRSNKFISDLQKEFEAIGFKTQIPFLGDSKILKKAEFRASIESRLKKRMPFPPFAHSPGILVTVTLTSGDTVRLTMYVSGGGWNPDRRTATSIEYERVDKGLIIPLVEDFLEQLQLKITKEDQEEDP